MANNIKMDYKKYIQHKEYFDSGLIDLLERQQARIIKLNNTTKIYEAVILKRNQSIRNLSFKLKELTIKSHNLVSKVSKDNDELINIIKEQDKKIDELDKVISDELIKSYDENNKLYDENRKLKEELEKLKKRNDKYKKSIKLNSTNSSLPPSSDLFKVKPTNSRVKTNKKIGGQKGHELHQSKLKANADEIVIKYVSKAPQAAKLVKDENNNDEYYITQEIDVKLKARVVETRYYVSKQYKRCDNTIMKKYRINSVSYADSFKSMVLYLNSKGTIPLERLCLIINELSQDMIKLSEGSIVNWQKEFNEKSKRIVEGLEREVMKSAIIHVDETGWKVDGKTKWMHVLTSKDSAIFYCSDKRSGIEEGAISKIKDYNNYIVHDHFKPYYTYVTKAKHVECNAHILRYLKAGVEGYESIGCIKLITLFQKMLTEKKKLIRKNNFEMSGEKIAQYEIEYLKIIDKELKEYYQKNPEIAKKYEAEYIKLFKRMRENKEEHLKFIKDFRVPFDNNHAERMIRSIKIKKKVSGQSKTLAMAQSYARIHTINQTCNLREMNTLKTIEAIFQSKDPFNCFFGATKYRVGVGTLQNIVWAIFMHRKISCGCIFYFKLNYVFFKSI